jgi:hypothetical protein
LFQHLLKRSIHRLIGTDDFVERLLDILFEERLHSLCSSKALDEGCGTLRNLLCLLGVLLCPVIFLLEVTEILFDRDEVNVWRKERNDGVRLSQRYVRPILSTLQTKTKNSQGSNRL